uniref:NIN1 (RPN12) binding protein 1 homolog n=1 Tax=Sander lucioperca TaxID=283035 RepID=A0A8C9Y1F9_SANLU
GYRQQHLHADKMWWTRSGTNPPEERVSGLPEIVAEPKVRRSRRHVTSQHVSESLLVCRLSDRVSKKTGDYPSLSATDIKVLALTYQLELEHVGYQHLKKEPEIKVPQGETSGIYTHARTRTHTHTYTRTHTRTHARTHTHTHARTRRGGRRRGVDHASNIQQVKMESGDWTAPADVTVGCLTTDFAMQNVLIQMGLHVLSVNGMLIKEARNYILRCHAALSETTSNMSKVFCPHCGNKTLKKLAVTVTEDGPTHTHTHTLTNSSLWAFQHSLPLPRGGKHSNNPQLVEDQSFPQQRLSRKARQKTDNDIYSRAANLQIRDGQSGGGRRRTNPNATHKKFVKKK